MSEKGVRFGQTGMRVSPLTLGTWGIGGSGWDAYADEVRVDAIRAAVECGINLIDTAPAYNAGEAERYIGRALEQTGLREKVRIVTKCGNRFINGQYIRNGRAENIFEECEESLKNLKTDHIDVMLVHWPDPNIPLSETFGALKELKEQGKILHIGASNFTKEQILEAGRTVRFEVLQLQYSMVNRDNEELLKWAHAEGIGTMAYGALAGGLLTGRYRSVQNYEAGDNRNRFYGRFFSEPNFTKIMRLLEVMQPIADGHGASLAETALNWVRRKDFVDTCIAGAQKRERVEGNAKCLQWELTAAEQRQLDDAVGTVLQ